jgi:hypothetical protein
LENVWYLDLVDGAPRIIFSRMYQAKQIAIGWALITFFFLVLGGIAAWAYLPGFVGELGRMCLALITSPFLMETSIFFLALTMLFAINGWRRNREGDDYVTLDENGVPKRDK